jgi:hypothetical protein
MTPAIYPCHGFSVIAGVVDTGDKFITGVKDTGEKFIIPVSLTLLNKNFISKFLSFFAGVVDTADKYSFAIISANFRNLSQKSRVRLPLIQHCFICPPPSDFTVLEDAEIESRTVATSVLTVRHSETSIISVQKLCNCKFFLIFGHTKPRSGSQSQISESEYETPFGDHFSILQKAQSTYSKWLEYFP